MRTNREAPTGPRRRPVTDATVTGHVSAPATVARPGAGRSTGIRVVRPTDLVVLTVDWVGLKLDSAEEGAPRLVKDSGGEAYLVLELPPQHILEQAFFEKAKGYHPPKIPKRKYPYDQSEYVQPQEPDKETDTETPLPPPIEHLIAGPSRLVFRVAAQDLPLELTLSNILEKCRTLPLSVPANALPPPSRALIHLACSPTCCTGRGPISSARATSR